MLKIIVYKLLGFQSATKTIYGVIVEIFIATI